MSAAWRNVFTYNKYAQITARAVRTSLKEEERLVAEKRGLTALRYQRWDNGKGGQQTVLAEEDAASRGAGGANAS